MESFIEFIPSKCGYIGSHYVAHKKINNLWLTFNDSKVRKSYMARKFQVQLAFYRNTSSTVAVQYNYDFALFKQTPHPRLPKVSMIVVEKEDTTADSAVTIEQQSQNVDEVESGGTVVEEQQSQSTDTGNVESGGTVVEEQQSQSTDNVHVESGTLGVEQDAPSQENTDSQNVSTQQKETDASEEQVKNETPVEAELVTHQLIVHIEMQTVDEFKKKYMEQSMCNRLLVVRIKKYPNLLKRYQEGNVHEPKYCPDFKRLCQIRRKYVGKSDVLDLDFLAHKEYGNINRSIEVETLSEGRFRETYERKNPVPPDPDDEEEMTEDGENVLWDKSQQKLAKIKGNQHSASANPHILKEINLLLCILLSYTCQSRTVYPVPYAKHQYGNIISQLNHFVYFCHILVKVVTCF